MRCAAWVAGLLLVVGSACSEDREPPATGTTTGTTGTTGTTDASGDSTAGVDPTTGPMWPTPFDDDLLTCVRTCELPSDCCPPNTAGLCPASTYPYNYACYEGICVFPPCLGDADCTGEGEVCREVGGLPSCILPCDDDAPCTAVSSEQTCSGTADDGSRYCFAHCSNPGVFCGNASCDEASGVCVCSSVGQCLSDWDCI